MVKHMYSPLECYLEIYAARQVVQHSRKNAKHREDQIQAEADLVHFQNHLKECTGIPGEVDSGLSKKEMHAPGQEKSANFKGSAVFHSHALVAFFEMTCGYGWARRSGWVGRAPTRKIKPVPFFAVDPSNWYGVGINRPRQRASSCSAATASRLGAMSALTDLDLSCNHLEGTVPEELGDAMALTRLDLSSNALDGELPDMLGDLDRLRTFKVAANGGLRGSVPASFAGLTALTDLDLAENAFSGPVPPFAALLTNLTCLDLSHNAFDGPLPPLPPSLTTLDLGHNAVSGGVAPEFCQTAAATLETCFLNNNALEGPVPAEIGDMVALRSLNLSHNRLSGLVPDSVTRLTNARSLDLQGNALEGVTIPQGLEDLPNLQYYMGAEGFASHYLQRPKRFDRYRFAFGMEFQKIYAGPTRLPPATGGRAPPAIRRSMIQASRAPAADG
ncbi:hypothetical protein JL720_11692 [Aureococcus anophagefferens]|nr:hypothetical protein JL720_11692 [Aureococcus anophagefferens]